MATTNNTNGGPLNLSAFSGFDRNNRGGNSNQQSEKDNAEYWLNIGYETSVKNSETGEEESIFVSLARGIPLDSIVPFDVSKTRSSNMAQLRDAQNGLHEMFMGEAKKLEPGEAKLLIIDEAIGLAVQIKRVKAEQEVPAENSLRKVVSFERPNPATTELAAIERTKQAKAG